MATLGKAVIEFSADTAKFTSDVGRAAVTFDRNMAQMTRGLAEFRNLVVAAAGVGGIVALVKSSIDAADQLGKLSQKVGITVERLSELKLAASLSNVEFDMFRKGLRDFNLALAEAGDENSKAAGVFKALGVDIKQGPDAAFRAFAEQMSKLPDGFLKTAAAQEILKKSGSEMIPMLNGGAKALDDAALKARKLGLVISEEFAKQASEFNDNMTLIGKRSEALGIALGGKFIGGLTEITGKLSEAAQNGNFFGQALLEIAKGAALVAAAFPEGSGLGEVGQRSADFLFQAEQRAKLMREGPNLWPKADGPQYRGPFYKPGSAGATSAFVGPQMPAGYAPNTAQLACVVSGGKWVNGACQREKPKKEDDMAAVLADALQKEKEILDEANKIFADDALKKKAEREKDLELMVKSALDAEAAYAKALHAFHTGEGALGDEENIATRMQEVAQETQKVNDWARQLGLTFTSAFEDAAVGGKKFSDILKGIEMDIARLIIRKTITEPAGKAITDAIGKVDFGKLFSGGDANMSSVDMYGFAAGGRPPMGVASLVGERGPELFIPDTAGRIVPSGGRLGGGGVTIIQHISVDARSDQASIMLAMRQAKDAAVAEISSRQYRTGEARIG